MAHTRSVDDKEKRESEVAKAVDDFRVQNPTEIQPLTPLILEQRKTVIKTWLTRLEGKPTSELYATVIEKLKDASEKWREKAKGHKARIKSIDALGIPFTALTKQQVKDFINTVGVAIKLASPDTARVILKMSGKERHTFVSGLSPKEIETKLESISASPLEADTRRKEKSETLTAFRDEKSDGKRRVGAMGSEITRLKDELEKLKIHLQDVNKEKTELEATLQSAANENTQNQEKINYLEADLRVKDESITRLNKNIEDKEQQEIEYLDSVRKNKEENKALKLEKEKLQSELEQARVALETGKTALLGTKEGIAKIQGDLTQKDKTIQDLQSQRDQIEAKLVETQVLLDRAHTEQEMLQKLESEKNKLQSELKQTQRALEIHKTALPGGFAKIKENLVQKNKTIQDLELQCAQTEKKLSAAQTALDKARKEYQSKYVNTSKPTNPESSSMRSTSSKALNKELASSTSSVEGESKHKSNPVNKIFEEQNVDLYKYPNNIRESDEDSEFTMGDLHGNTMKLLRMLVKEDIATNITPEEYEKLAEIYKGGVEKITAEGLRNFDNIIEKIKFKKKGVRLIGDELADRGTCDYFTLKVLKEMYKQEVPVEIIESNHGLQFRGACEQYLKNGKFSPLNPNYNNQFNSLMTLNTLVENKQIESQWILDTAKQVYFPALKMFSYKLSADETAIKLYTHAPIDIEMIKDVATQLKIDFKDASAKELADTIDRINAEFQKKISNNSISSLYAEKGSALSRAVWNRPKYAGDGENKAIKRPSKYNGYSVEYVHGHEYDENEKPVQHVINTDADNELGKFTNTGTYRVFYASPNHIQKPSQRMQEHVDKQLEREEVATYSPLSHIPKVAFDDSVEEQEAEKEKNVESLIAPKGHLAATLEGKVKALLLRAREEKVKTLLLRARDTQLNDTSIDIDQVDQHKIIDIDSLDIDNLAARLCEPEEGGQLLSCKVVYQRIRHLSTEDNPLLEDDDIDGVRWLLQLIESDDSSFQTHIDNVYRNKIVKAIQPDQVNNIANLFISYIESNPSMQDKAKGELINSFMDKIVEIESSYMADKQGFEDFIQDKMSGNENSNIHDLFRFIFDLKNWKDDVSLEQHLAQCELVAKQFHVIQAQVGKVLPASTYPNLRAAVMDPINLIHLANNFTDKAISNFINATTPTAVAEAFKNTNMHEPTPLLCNAIASENRQAKIGKIDQAINNFPKLQMKDLLVNHVSREGIETVRDLPIENYPDLFRKIGEAAAAWEENPSNKAARDALDAAIKPIDPEDQLKNSLNDLEAVVQQSKEEREAMVEALQQLAEETHVALKKITLRPSSSASPRYDYPSALLPLQMIFEENPERLQAFVRAIAVQQSGTILYDQENVTQDTKDAIKNALEGLVKDLDAAANEDAVQLAFQKVLVDNNTALQTEDRDKLIKAVKLKPEECKRFIDRETILANAGFEPLDKKDLRDEYRKRLKSDPDNISVLKKDKGETVLKKLLEGRGKDHLKTMFASPAALRQALRDRYAAETPQELKEVLLSKFDIDLMKEPNEGREILKEMMTENRLLLMLERGDQLQLRLEALGKIDLADIDKSDQDKFDLISNKVNAKPSSSFYRRDRLTGYKASLEDCKKKLRAACESRNPEFAQEIVKIDKKIDDILTNNLEYKVFLEKKYSAEPDSEKRRKILQELNKVNSYITTITGEVDDKKEKKSFGLRDYVEDIFDKGLFPETMAKIESEIKSEDEMVGTLKVETLITTTDESQVEAKIAKFQEDPDPSAPPSNSTVSNPKLIQKVGIDDNPDDRTRDREHTYGAYGFTLSRKNARGVEHSLKMVAKEERSGVSSSMQLLIKPEDRKKINELCAGTWGSPHESLLLLVIKIIDTWVATLSRSENGMVYGALSFENYPPNELPSDFVKVMKWYLENKEPNGLVLTYKPKGGQLGAFASFWLDGKYKTLVAEGKVLAPAGKQEGLEPVPHTFKFSRGS